MAGQDDVLIRTYVGPSPQEAGERFEWDSRAVAEHGYKPTARYWDGRQLKVVYQREPQPSAASEVGQRTGSFLTLAGGLLMLVGIALPWVSWFDGTGTLSGFDLGGLDPIIVGITALGVVVGAVLSRPALAALSAVAGGAAAILSLQIFDERLAVAASELVQVSVGALDLDGGSVESAPLPVDLTAEFLGFSAGIGLWAVMAGAAIALVGAGATWLLRRGGASPGPSGEPR